MTAKDWRMWVPCVGMLVAVAVWTTASMSHAFMSGVAGFAVARALLGLGEGATFPGGLRTAVESLPVEKRARGIATSFSGGTIGAIVTPLMVVPIALAYGWRTAFLLTGGAEPRPDASACPRPGVVKAS